MQIENIIKIIDKVSEKKISYFSYQENDEKITIKSKNNGNIKVVPEVKLQDIDYDDSENLQVVNSPIVGTFYTSKSQDSKPFVSVGDTIKKGQTLAIIEAMKIMNEIESPFDGVIESIEAVNGQTVEYGQLLFKIK